MNLNIYINRELASKIQKLAKILSKKGNAIIQRSLRSVGGDTYWKTVASFSA